MTTCADGSSWPAWGPQPPAWPASGCPPRPSDRSTRGGAARGAAAADLVGNLLAAGDNSREPVALLAGIYTLTTRMLIKLDDQQLGWMAADRARVLASGRPRRGPGHHARADRPRRGHRRRARPSVLLRDHGGGFTPATVGLHRISAENYAGDPGAAVAAAARIDPASLPTTERRARYWTDTARAYGNWGRREGCVSALLAAEREASEETHARPAVRDLSPGCWSLGGLARSYVASQAVAGSPDRLRLRPEGRRPEQPGEAAGSVPGVQPRLQWPPVAADHGHHDLLVQLAGRQPPGDRPASGPRTVIPAAFAAWQAMAVASASVAPSMRMPRFRVGPSPGPSGAE